jgi:hypothetical protein
VAIVPLIVFDLIAPARETDTAVITAKDTRSRRGSTRHEITARGRYSYAEEVPRHFYRVAQEGDKLQVSLTPIFSEWKKMSIIRDGQVIASSQGTELLWMGAFGLFFLVTLCAYLPERVILARLRLAVAIPVLELVGAMLWLRFALLWAGQIEKM